MFLRENNQEEVQIMEQSNYTTNRKKHKHILEKDRYTIEQMLNAGREIPDIVDIIGCSERTLKREIKRGTWEYLDGKTYEIKTKYSWDVAQRKHDENAKNKGRYAKINDVPELRKFIENQIKTHKYSPEAALMKAKNEGDEVEISVKTLYNNIDSGEIGVTRKDLLRKDGWKQDKSKPRKALNNLKGESIDNRPAEANDRSEYGHWEIDLVVSCKGGKGALLTLTERKNRQEIIRKLPDKKQKSVLKALKSLRKSHEFKTLTADNGSEFLDFKSIENALKCKVFYAHPYSSWERGSNENANGMIRRFFPKGTDFGKVSLKRIQAVENWINDYPRRILGGISANKAVCQM
jgi:IS30 family transposase